MSGTGPGSERPRPQFGEYATPEEQRDAIKEPAPWQIEAAADAQAPAPVEQQPPAPGGYHPYLPPQHPQHPGAQHPHPAQQYAQQHPGPQPGQQQPYPGRRPAQSSPLDRLLTFGLLGFGLYNVISMVANAVLGGSLMRQSAERIGGDEEQLIAHFPDWTWVAIAVAYSVVWLVALFASLRALRGGRIAFWIPLVAGILASLIAVALGVIALGENPELLNELPTPGSGGSPT